MAFAAAFQPIKETFSDFSSDKAPRLAAALAYYTIFSLAPLLIIVIAVAGLIWGQEAVRGELVSQFSSLIGEQGGKQIETMIANAGQQRTGGLMVAIGVITLIIGALGVFAQLKDALNTVWEVKLKSPGGWRGLWLMIRTYLLSFAMIFVIAFLLMASLVASAALAAMGKWMGNVLPIPEPVLYAMNLVLSFAVITLLFAAIYKILPDVQIAWRDVWAGAAVTAALFTLGKFALGFYLGRSSAASVYGAAGSVVIILLWVYYAAMIFLLGAEFTQVYARRWGSRIQPSAWAERIEPVDRARQGLKPQRKSSAGRNGDDERPRREKESQRRVDQSRSRSFAEDGEMERGP